MKLFSLFIKESLVEYIPTFSYCENSDLTLKNRCNHNKCGTMNYL